MLQHYNGRIFQKYEKETFCKSKIILWSEIFPRYYNPLLFFFLNRGEGNQKYLFSGLKSFSWVQKQKKYWKMKGRKDINKEKLKWLFTKNCKCSFSEHTSKLHPLFLGLDVIFKGMMAKAQAFTLSKQIWGLLFPALSENRDCTFSLRRKKE